MTPVRPTSDDDAPSERWLKTWERLARLEERLDAQSDRLAALEAKVEQVASGLERRFQQTDGWLKRASLTVGLAAITTAAAVAAAILGR